MSQQNYTSLQIDGVHVKVMNNVLLHLSASGLALFIDKEARYAAYGHRLKCRRHAVQFGCECPPVFSRVGFLHELTDRLHHPDRPLGRDQVVHHKVNRFDNRIKNLERLTRSQHAKHHNQRRQKHSFRERFDARGLYRPRRPGPVVELTPQQVEGSLAPPASTKRPKSFKQRLHEAEKLLERQFATLHRELAHLDSGKPIPKGTSRAAWRASETRSLGLRMPRLQCTPAEGAVVLAAIKHRDAENVQQAVAEELGTATEFVAEWWQRPSVAVARDRWVRHQRLPTVGRKSVRD